MTEEASEDGGADRDATEAGPLRRAWRALSGAGQWVADTFRGHSGAHQMRDRER